MKSHLSLTDKVKPCTTSAKLHNNCVTIHWVTGLGTKRLETNRQLRDRHKGDIGTS